MRQTAAIQAGDQAALAALVEEIHHFFEERRTVLAAPAKDQSTAAPAA